MSKRKRVGPWWEDPEARDFLAEAEANLAPKVADSHVTLAIWDGKVDPKIAIEMGYMVLLDKPIIAVVRPGVKVPAKLAKVVDRFVECDDPRDPKCREALMRALNEFGVGKEA